MMKIKMRIKIKFMIRKDEDILIVCKYIIKIKIGIDINR